jgi:hypothetical protein
MNKSIHQNRSDKHTRKEDKKDHPSHSDQSPSPNNSAVPETVTKTHPKATPKKDTQHE